MYGYSAVVIPTRREMLMENNFQLARLRPSFLVWVAVDMLIEILDYSSFLFLLFLSNLRDSLECYKVVCLIASRWSHVFTRLNSLPILNFLERKIIR